MKHIQVWVFAMLLALAVEICSQCVIWRVQFFVKMTCRRVLAKPRRPVLFQNICMHVNEWQWVCTAYSRERTVNSLELVMVLHGLVTSTDFYCMLKHVYQWFAKFQYVGDIWNFGKHLSQLVYCWPYTSCWLVCLFVLMFETLRL